MCSNVSFCISSLEGAFLEVFPVFISCFSYEDIHCQTRVLTSLYFLRVGFFVFSLQFWALLNRMLLISAAILITGNSLVSISSLMFSFVA